MISWYDLTTFKEHNGSNLGTNTDAKTETLLGQTCLTYTDPQHDLDASTELYINGIQTSMAQQDGWFKLDLNNRYYPSAIGSRVKGFIVRYEAYMIENPPPSGYMYVQPAFRDNSGASNGTIWVRGIYQFYFQGSSSNWMQIKTQYGPGEDIIASDSHGPDVWPNTTIFELVYFTHGETYLGGGAIVEPMAFGLLPVGLTGCMTHNLDRDDFDRDSYPIIAFASANNDSFWMRSDTDNSKFCTCFLTRMGEWACPAGSGWTKPAGTASVDRLVVHADQSGMDINTEIKIGADAWAAVPDDGDLSDFSFGADDEVLTRFSAWNYYDSTNAPENSMRWQLLKRRPIIYAVGIQYTGGAPGHMQRHDAYRMGPSNP